MRRCLLDTGPLVAFFDSAEAGHLAVLNWMRSYTGEFITTGGVVTETFHFLGPSEKAIGALVEFLEQPGIRILDCFAGDALRRARVLIGKYASVPMDFADASLVWAAEVSSTEDILTFDVRGFRTYRYARSRTFNLVFDAVH